MAAGLKRTWVLTIALYGLVLCSVPARPRAAEFYDGKTLTIIVGLNAGGTVDTFVRQLSSYLKKHTPGAPNIVVLNMPGAGGVVAGNFLAERAPKDGSTILFQIYDPLAQALGNQGLRARYEQFEVFGGISDTRVIYARTDAVAGGIKSPADIMKAQGIAVGALNNTDISGLVAKLALEVLGVKHKFITGYRGGNDIFLAIQRGEVQLHTTSIGTLRTRGAEFLSSGTGIGIAYLAATDKAGQFEASKYITGIPAFPDLYAKVHGKPPAGPSWVALNWLVQQFSDVAYVGLGPAGSPAPAVAALRRGFEGAINDPDFVAQSVKTNGLPYSFVTAERGKAVFRALADVSPEILDTVRRSIGDLAK